MNSAIGICHAGYADCLLAGSESPDDGQKTCPKHVDFYSKNKFEKLVHLVGFIIRRVYTFHVSYIWATYSSHNLTDFNILTTDHTR